MVELYKGLWELFPVAFFMVALNLRENELWSLCSVERMIESSLFSDFLSLTETGRGTQSGRTFDG